MISQPFKIVFACNDAYFDGLYLSILSIVRRCKHPINFYLLTANYTELNKKYKNLSSKNSKKILAMIKRFNKMNNFIVIDCTKKAKHYLLSEKNVNRKHFSPYTNLRLLIHLFPFFDEKVLYLDTDIMACGNVSKVFDVKVGDNEIVVCHNWWLRNTIAKGTFNAGVILFNMKKIRQTKLLDKAINLFNSKRMAWADQTAIVKAATKVKFFPKDEYRFNRQSERIHKGDILKHFCNRPGGWPFWNNIKQWDIKNVHKHLKIFEFDEDYEYWLKNKR